MDDELQVSMGRLESKIDSNNITLNAKIDNLSDKLDFKMENVIAKISAGDNEANARLSLLQERHHGLQSRMTDLESSVRRAYAFLAAIAVAVVAGVITTAVQALAK